MLAPIGPIAWGLTLAFLLAPAAAAAGAPPRQPPLRRGRADHAARAGRAAAAADHARCDVRAPGRHPDGARAQPAAECGLDAAAGRHPPGRRPGARWLRENLSISTEQLMASATEAAQSALKALATAGGGVVLGAVGTVFGFFVMLFILLPAARRPRDAPRGDPPDPAAARAARRDPDAGREHHARGRSAPASPHSRRACWSASASRSPTCRRRSCSACSAICALSCRWRGHRLGAGRRRGCSSTARSCWSGRDPLGLRQPDPTDRDPHPAPVSTLAVFNALGVVGGVAASWASPAGAADADRLAARLCRCRAGAGRERRGGTSAPARRSSRAGSQRTRRSRRTARPRRRAPTAPQAGTRSPSVVRADRMRGPQQPAGRCHPDGPLPRSSPR